MIKISIIVPVFKAEKTLERAINSILNQSFLDYEVILVDDGSPDNSGIICDKYTKVDDRFKVIHKENGGVSSARNVGLDNAIGEYILFLDADDEIANECLALLYERALRFGADITIGMMDIIDTFTGKTTHHECLYDYERVLNRKEVHDVFLEGKFLGKDEGKKNYARWDICSCLYKNSLIYKHKLRFSTSMAIGEDLRFALEALAVAESVVCTQVPVRIYFYDSKNVGKKYALTLEKAVIEGYDYQMALIKNFGLDKNCKYNVLGSTWCGVFTYTRTMINRGYAKRDIKKYYRNKQVRKCLWGIIFMSRKHRTIANISRKDILPAIFFLIGKYSKALKYLK